MGRLLRARRGAILVFAALAALPLGCSTSSNAPAAQNSANDPGKVVWHDLTTDDPASCKKFYAALLGWQYVDTTVLGRPYSVARLGTKSIGGIHAPSWRAPARLADWLSYMSVADVDASVNKAKAAGGGVLAGPLDVDSVGRAAVLIDPQGARSVLSAFPRAIRRPRCARRRHVLLERVPHARSGRYARVLQRARSLRDDRVEDQSGESTRLKSGGPAGRLPRPGLREGRDAELAAIRLRVRSRLPCRACRGIGRPRSPRAPVREPQGLARCRGRPDRRGCRPPEIPVLAAKEHRPCDTAP